LETVEDEQEVEEEKKKKQFTRGFIIIFTIVCNWSLS
jgi:hypothetical protein